MKRRTFLKGIFAFLGTTATVSFLYPMVRFLTPPRGEVGSQTMTFLKKDIPLNRSLHFVFNKMPAVVINQRERGYIAFSRVCTHLGCLVDYDAGSGMMVCPCHAGRYDLEGTVLSGPPPRPLQKLPVKVEGDHVVIG